MCVGSSDMAWYSNSKLASGMCKLAGTWRSVLRTLSLTGLKTLQRSLRSFFLPQHSNGRPYLNNRQTDRSDTKLYDFATIAENGPIRCQVGGRSGYSLIQKNWMH